MIENNCENNGENNGDSNNISKNNISKNNCDDNSDSTNIRVGVYVCHCGGNISDVICVKKVAEGLANYPNVAISKEYVFMCSDAGQKLIIEDITSGKINRVVVAACSPALHELTFRKALQRAGLNPFLYEHVNIREQASWVHKKEPEAATQKAILLTRAGIEKIRRQEGLENIRVGANKHAIVIGGGPAGMRSAISLADRGLQVSLVESGNKLGGRLLEIDTVYPTNEKAEDILETLKTDIRARKNIGVYLNNEIANISGFVGNFQATLKNGETIAAGAVVMATGNKSYEPFEGEFGYRTQDNVVTMPEFHGILCNIRNNTSTNKDFIHNGKHIQSIAFIHCVGSRQQAETHQPQADGKLNEYCSRICCSTTLQAVNEVKKHFPNVKVFDVYRDIRTYARFTEDGLYEKASKNGTLFFRYTEEQLPTVQGKNITVKDVLTWNEEVTFEAELIVLATGIVPNNITNIVEKLKLPIGADRFLSEAHPKLRPVEVANTGVYLAGTCQAPMDLVESCVGAAAASSKAAIVLGKDHIELDPYVAFVKPEKCDGCQKCLPECSYVGAIFMNKDGKAEVNPALCKGCGACVAVCPQRALDLKGWSLEQIEAMVDAIAEA